MFVFVSGQVRLSLKEVVSVLLVFDLSVNFITKFSAARVLLLSHQWIFHSLMSFIERGLIDQL